MPKNIHESKSRDLIDTHTKKSVEAIERERENVVLVGLSVSFGLVLFSGIFESRSRRCDPINFPIVWKISRTYQTQMQALCDIEYAGEKLSAGRFAIGITVHIEIFVFDGRKKNADKLFNFVLKMAAFFVNYSKLWRD